MNIVKNQANHPPSVDIVDDIGIDCTREPDWQVVKSDNLPEKPQPNQVHNDKYWDERSLDQEISKIKISRRIDPSENRKILPVLPGRETTLVGLFRTKCLILTIEGAILHPNHPPPITVLDSFI